MPENNNFTKQTLHEKLDKATPEEIRLQATAK